MTGGHGHVTPRQDGAKARCGGPAICAVCAIEAAEFASSKLRVADMIAPAVSDAQELAEHMALVTEVGRAGWACDSARLRAAELAVEASAKRLMGLQP